MPAPPTSDSKPAPFAVVIVSFHTGPALWAAVAGALSAPETARLVVVDNGNDAATLQRLEQLAGAEPRLTVITGQGNVGFAKGCNLGAARTSDPLLLFMNPDCEPLPDAFAALADALAADPTAWAAAPLLVDPAGRIATGTPRRALTPRTMLGEALRLDRLLPVRFPRLNLHEEPMPAAPFAIEACSGACMAIRRDRFVALGGFDEGYFLHVEDLDMCWRIGLAGGRLLCVPAARVRHLGGTSRAPATAVERHKARGFVRYLSRHFRFRLGRPLLWLLIGLVWVRYGARVLGAAFRQRPSA